MTSEREEWMNFQIGGLRRRYRRCACSNRCACKRNVNSEEPAPDGIYDQRDTMHLKILGMNASGVGAYTGTKHECREESAEKRSEPNLSAIIPLPRSGGRT
jgi:hypothetical protein